MSQTLRRFRSLCDRLPKSRVDRQYEKLSTGEQFAVLGGAAAVVVLFGEVIGGAFANAAILVALAFGIFSGLTSLLARRHE